MDQRAAMLAAISGLVIGVAGAYAIRADQPAKYASAIQRGADRARDDDGDRVAAENDLLVRDANDAGYRWAERRALTNVGDCPTYPAAFRDGCEAYANEQSQP